MNKIKPIKQLKPAPGSFMPAAQMILKTGPAVSPALVNQTY